MKKIIDFILISCAVLLFFTGQAQADQDILRPVGDRDGISWIAYPSGDDYTCIDEATANEDTDYLYTVPASGWQGWYHTDFTAGTIDSVMLTVRHKSLATSGSPEIVIGRAYYMGEGIWGWCTNDNGIDTISLGASYANDSITWTTDPYDGNAWTQVELNNTNRAWAWYKWAVGTVPDTILEDDFDDNSLDTDKWRDRSLNGSSATTEQNQQLELVLDHTAHTGAGVLTKSRFGKAKTYTLTVKLKVNASWGHQAVGYGHDGIWIIPGDTSSAMWNPSYGTPEHGLFFRLGNGCGRDNNGVGIYYDDDDGWECAWTEEVVDDNTAEIIDSSSAFYDIKIVFNGSSGECSLFVDDDLKCDGTLGSTNLSDLGDSVYFQLFQSYYITDTKLDIYDDFVLTKEVSAQNRVTQSFLTVFYSAVVEGQVIIVH